LTRFFTRPASPASHPTPAHRPSLPDTLSTIAGLLLLAILAALGCTASRHPTVPSTLGVARSSDDLLAVIDEPGPIAFEKVVAADWAVDRSGLINLDHPKAREAGLEDGPEAIQIYFYVLEHPDNGTFIVDSGIERGFEAPAENDRVSFIVRQAMNVGALRVHVTMADWLAARAQPLSGVFLTHIHIDHVMGLPDLPASTPVYAGPGEPDARAFLNMFTRGTIDRLTERQGALREWRFEPDPAGRFAGVIDVFGDGSLWALHVPGHSPGSTAFVVRTPDGPQLLLGDATHTAWGWRNGVEPGTFSHDQPLSVRSLAGLLALSERFPRMPVHPGHQSLPPLELAARSQAQTP
jgi:glyoxylase-like metal-dependent hydrolase (beta-lactamase superfamily II)